jgi:myo-inositol 2-dehydrogenase / D-chiro-inositol 1-dehydrogenase
MVVRVGIIGVGVMGADHARILVSHVPGCVLQAIYDADPARATAIAIETGAASIASDPHSLINSDNIDAVIVASPDSTHHDLTLACISANKPVLCEKPLAPSAAECLEIVNAEIAKGRRLVQTGYMRRFDPSYVDMKAALQSGQLGKALIFHCMHRNVSSPSWFTSKMAIANSAVHEFDVARWVLDVDFTQVSVFKPSAYSADPNGAPVFLVLSTSKGQLVNIEVYINATYGYDVRGELVCEKGVVSLSPSTNNDVSFNLQQARTYPADWRPRFAAAYRIQLVEWIKAIKAGTSVGASAWDGYAAAVISEAALLSLAEGRTVDVNVETKPNLYQ